MGSCRSGIVVGVSPEPDPDTITRRHRHPIGARTGSRFCSATAFLQSATHPPHRPALPDGLSRRGLFIRPYPRCIPGYPSPATGCFLLLFNALGTYIMKLADYIFDNSISPGQLRWMLGCVKHRSTLYRYLTGERIPQPETLQKIIEITDGQVQLRDFLNKEPPECATVVVTGDGKRKVLLPWSQRSHNAQAANDNENEHARLSAPVKRALQVLSGRAWFTPRGRFLLDGRQVDIKLVMQAANTALLCDGNDPIPYPGVQHPSPSGDRS